MTKGSIADLLNEIFLFYFIFFFMPRLLSFIAYKVSDVTRIETVEFVRTSFRADFVAACNSDLLTCLYLQA